MWVCAASPACGSAGVGLGGGGPAGVRLGYTLGVAHSPHGQ